MFIAELFENKGPDFLVIYPGRFQPFHKGHKSVYDHLIERFGSRHVYIATSNKTDDVKSPFSYEDKVKFMQLAGVNLGHVKQTREPYKAQEITANYDPDSTRLIFAVSEKDMAEDPRFASFVKKDGSPTYMQLMPEDSNKMQPFKQHGYIYVVPTVDFTVMGEPMRSATKIREKFVTLDRAGQQHLIKDLFGRYDPVVHNILKDKLKPAHK